MALLTQALRSTALCAACVTLAGSCSAGSSLGHVAVWLRDCGDGTCDRASGPPRAARHFEAPAFVDSSVSRFAPNGLYAYFELEQPDGTSVRVELDVPTDRVGPLSEYDASYREWDGNRIRFEATRMQGVLVPPPSVADAGGSCACMQGRFELRFTDAGPDRELGTADDRERDLSQGWIGAEESVCAVSTPLPRPAELQVQPMDCSPVRTAVPAPPPPTIARTTVSRTGASASYTGGVYLDPAAEPGYAGGCGASQEDSYAESGCESGGAMASTTDEGAGCGSDPQGAPREQAGSCEGDRYEDDGSCEGDRDDRDAPNCRIPRDRRSARARSGSGAFIGLGLPLLLAYLGLSLRARRSKRVCAERG